MDIPTNPPATRSRLGLLSAMLRLHRAGLAGALCLALALALRLYRLGAQSLWLDEGGTWAEVTGRTGKGWLALLGELFSKDAAYPLYHVLLKCWVALAGDTERALRFPSALAGAVAVLVLFFAACGLRRGDTETGRQAEQHFSLSRFLPFSWPFFSAIVAALLMATSPFALWQSQDAKVYSLLMLCVTLLIWALLRALRAGVLRDWLVLLAVALLSVFVHRLGLLAVAGALVVLVAAWPLGGRGRRRLARWGLAAAALLCAVLAIYGAVRAVGSESRGGTGHIPAGPLSGLWLSLAHFALDRGNIGGWLGLPLLVWALPALVLTAWGLLLLARDARYGSQAAIVLVGMLLAPLLLFSITLGFAHLFESRYVTVAFPAWVLTLSYPFTRRPTDDESPVIGTDEQIGTPSSVHRLSSIFAALTLSLVLLVNTVVLLQPQHGLFSGAAVKEQWREGVAEIAGRAHPDDLIILHPYYVQPMWDYYAPRVTPDPLPKLVTFDLLGQGYCRDVARDDQVSLVECYRRNYEEAFDRAAYGRKRMLMLIAPDHARTIDPPLTAAELREKGYPASADDKYGFLGLRFQYAKEQRTWPCGGSGDALIGVEAMCVEFPSFYREVGPESIPHPPLPLEATFGDELRLRGYGLDLLGGQARPGGALPVTLYWEAASKPTRNYQMFLHLCGDCNVPPLASDDDAPPLHGYAPAGRTTTWIVGDPVHDERSLRLPDTVAPGRYTLLLGVYPEGDASEAARLPVLSNGQVLGGTRLVLGQVTVGQP
jgi:mannosyltransferase